MVKHFLSIVLIVGVGVCFYIATAYEVDFIRKFVMLSSDVTTDDEFTEVFTRWGKYIVASSVATALIWYIVGWFYKINDWRIISKMKTVWYALFLLPILVVGVALYKAPVIEKGTAWVVIFYITNSLILFYFSTFLLSPPSFKYIPIGACKARRW
ncbi:MAG: hypothetical protein HQK92_02395 [Nitrospirae bacterium]|nr:hypothetical protein [Nitrospirota bacterium]